MTPREKVDAWDFLLVLVMSGSAVYLLYGISEFFGF